MNLIFATNNQHKLLEIRHIFEKQGLDHIQLLGLKEIGFTGEIEEPGDTLEENALIKARFIHSKYGKNCFADDTGLEVDALDGQPGVYSARYAGEGCSYQDNVVKLLDSLNGIADRSARFRSVIALIINEKEYLFEGIVTGSILMAAKGTNGFGYDPVFMPDGFQLTYAEMPADIKNSISHRYLALEKMIRFLKENP